MARTCAHTNGSWEGKGGERKKEKREAETVCICFTTGKFQQDNETTGRKGAQNKISYAFLVVYNGRPRLLLKEQHDPEEGFWSCPPGISPDNQQFLG